MEQTTLKQLLEKGPVLAPCVYDCLSAKITERAGFQAMCLSGGELAASYCGLPDIGLVSLQELTDAVGRISASCSLPMIVDIDTGFGNELNVIHTCRKIAKAGAMAVHMEDQTFPKRCGHLQGKEVIPLEDYLGKIRAAAYALRDTDCLLIARTDAYNILGKEAAIERATASVEAGAHITLVEGTETLDISFIDIFILFVYHQVITHFINHRQKGGCSNGTNHTKATFGKGSRAGSLRL